MSNVLFHTASPRNRDAIRRDGLLCLCDQTGFGAVYLSDVDELAPGLDVWRVEVSGLSLDADFTTEASSGHWFMSFNDISASRLYLLHGR